MEVAAEAGITVEREVFIAAAPQTVWELLVDSKEMVRWMGMSVVLEPRRGGRYRVEVVPGRIAAGTIVELDPPRRLVHTFGWQGNENVPPGSTTVIYELHPRDNGTLLRFTHRDLPNADTAASHTQGWEHYLGRLTQVANGGDAGVDPWVTRRAIQNYFDALRSGNGWDAFLSDTMTFTSFTSPVKEVRGKSAYLEATKRFYGGIRSFELRDLLVDGRKAVALTRYELGRPGVEPFTSDVAEVFEVREGKIESFGIYFDSAPFPK